MTVAVVIAVLNEAASVERLLQALGAQTRTPDQVVFADGGSTDGTLEIIASTMSRLPFPVEVQHVPGKIAKGRNRAIASVACDIIAVTDADCLPGDSWLATLVAPIEGGRADASAGNYFAVASTPIERAIAAFTCVQQTSDSKHFLPSHRSVAYRRDVWVALGGYNETIDSGEDTLFDREVERRYPFAIVPEASVAWRPRRSLRSALWQQVFYGAGDGQARIQRTYHAAIAAFVCAEIAVATGRPWFSVPGALAIASAFVYFEGKRRRMFGAFPADAAYVAILACALPPARLLGFAVGLCGGSVRTILNRS